MTNNNLEGLGYRGKTVVVTGAASGMGQATARILGELGARVHVVDMNEPSIPHETFHRTDLTQPDQVSKTAAALRDIAPIHFLFSCAGVPPHTVGPMVCMKVNYIGTRQLIDEVMPAIEDGGGIAIIASDAAMAWQRNLAQNLELLAISDPLEAARWCEANPDKLRDGYTVSKEMLTVWVQHRAVSLAKERGIRLNCTWPCPTSTAFIDGTAVAISKDFWEQYPYPLLGRMATPDEQAWPLVLLNSPLNNVVTGAVLYTNQGFAGGLYTGAMEASSLLPK